MKPYDRSRSDPIPSESRVSPARNLKPSKEYSVQVKVLKNIRAPEEKYREGLGFLRLGKHKEKPWTLGRYEKLRDAENSFNHHNQAVPMFAGYRIELRLVFRDSVLRTSVWNQTRSWYRELQCTTET